MFSQWYCLFDVVCINLSMSLCKQETEGHPGHVLFFWFFCMLQTGLLHSVLKEVGDQIKI